MVNLVFEQFDNLELFSRCLNRPENKVFKGRYLSSKNEDHSGWAGTDDWDEAMNLFSNGWSEKADEIRRDFTKFERAEQRSVSYEKARPASSVVGFAPHVPNAILGLPNSMIHTERTPMKAKVVRIIYNMTMNCGTDAEDIMNTGLTVLKIVYSLERQGYRVRIDVNPFLAEKGKQEVCALVCVKDWRQPIDIKKVAFPIAHPAMFRRLGFRWLETAAELEERGYISGYGHSLEEAEDAKKVLRKCKVLGDNDYFVNVNIAKKAGYDPKKTAEAMGIKNV